MSRVVESLYMLCFAHWGSPDTRNDRHSAPCKVFFFPPPTLNPSLTITLSQILHVTNVRRENSVCVWLDVGPLTGMEAACWTNSLTNVSTFPPSLPPSPPLPFAKLTSTYRAERRGRGGSKEGGGKEERSGLTSGRPYRPPVWLCLSPRCSLRVCLWG